MLTTRYILDESHLSHYDERLKSWVSSQPVKTLPSSLYPWTLSDKAGAVGIWPVGGTELKPTVDFLFTEVPPASGDKGPENPSTITGVESVTVMRCGKNLCPLVGESSSSYISVSFTDNGEFVFNGSYIGLVDVYVFNNTYDINLFPDYLERGKTYTFSLQGDNSSVKFEVFRYYNGNYGGAVVSIAPGGSQTYTIPDTQSMILRFSIPANTVLNNAKFKLQIEEGSTTTSFEPYSGTTATVSLGDTYYGGEIDLATGLMTVTYRAFELTPSNLNIRTPTEISSGLWNVACLQLLNENTVNVFGYNASGGYNGNNYFCNILDWNGTGSAVSYHFSASNFYMTIEADSASAATSYITSLVAEKYAAGTPVFAGYPLATTYTVQLTPTEILSLSQSDKYTPRLNTVYTDASSVQVGYVKSPIREESELQQAIVAQGGNV